jgi:hypothetical protein
LEIQVPWGSVGTREIFLSFFLSFFSLQCSVGEKKIQPISLEDFIKFFFIIIISWDAVAEHFSALDSS